MCCRTATMSPRDRSWPTGSRWPKRTTAAATASPDTDATNPPSPRRGPRRQHLNRLTSVPSRHQHDPPLSDSPHIEEGLHGPPRGVGPVRRPGAPAGATTSSRSPAGGGPRRRAMTCASCSPSSSLGTGGDGCRFRSSACSYRSCTQRWRTFSTVLVRHEKPPPTERS